MGRRGPAPKPQRLRELQGFPDKRRRSSDEVQPPPGDQLRCQPWLHAYARAKWRQLAPKLLALGLFSELDGECLALACQAWADWRVATERLNAEGLTVEVGSQLQPHPCVGQARAAWERRLDFTSLRQASAGLASWISMSWMRRICSGRSFTGPKIWDARNSIPRPTA